MAKRTSKNAKGFGKKQPRTDDAPAAASDYDSKVSKDDPSPSSPPRVSSSSRREQNAGQQALEAMRSVRRNAKDDELRRMADMRSTDELLREERGAAAIPDRVADRMGKRMLPFVGVPLFGGMGAFVAFWYFATYRDVEFQPAVVATATVSILAVGLLGITYSVMSASWDPDSEGGSALGVEEFNSNLGEIKSGLKRSRDNAMLREKMAGLPEQDVKDAIRDLERRDVQRIRYKERLRDELTMDD